MIKRIKIRDFKSIRELDLELDPVTVLVGRSGAGKSNLVQAIRFLRNTLINHTEAVRCEGGWERIIPVGETAPKSSFEVDFIVPGEERDYSYHLAFGVAPGFGYQTLNSESLRLQNETLFARSRDLAGSTSVWTWEVEPKAGPMSPHSDAPLLGSFPSLQQVVYAYAALSTGVGYYHFPSRVLGVSGPTEAGCQFPGAVSGLCENAANYREVLRDITQDFRRANVRKGLVASLQKLNPDIQSIELDSLVNPKQAIVGHKADGRVFPLALEQESDGLRRFYAHLLALYQTPPKLTLAFEEPENAIFPGALALLAEEFQAAPREDRGQVILTTHSPIFLDAFDVDNLRLVEVRGGETVVGRVSSEQRQAVKDRLLTTGELLTVDPARLEDAEELHQAQ